MEYLKVLVLMFVCVYSESSPEKSSLKSFYETPVVFTRDFDKYKSIDDFDVVWNVPTDKCKNIDFEGNLTDLGIKVNTGGNFTGDQIIILYDPGDFPMMKELKNGNLEEINGGIPQKGDLNIHLKAFEEVIEKKVPKDFSGLGVIDFEVWRPVFRQHWNKQVIYRNKSIELVKKNLTNSQNMDSKDFEKQVNETAAKNFEEAAKKFMEGTLQLVKKLRPLAKWGYYGFPYCYGFRVKRTAHCPPPVPKENEQIEWLFNESTALYPSIYVSDNLTTEEQGDFYTGKMNEAWRMVQKVSKGGGNFIPVFPYFWFFYNNEEKFLTANDTYQALASVSQYRMGGLIVWGKSENVNTTEKCDDLLKYMVEVFGPALQKVRENNRDNFKKSLKVLGEIDFNDLTSEESSVGEEEEVAQKEEEELIQEDAFDI